jgi:thiamine-monophosphate kinase
VARVNGVNEFELIERFFTRGNGRRGDVIAGVGDDAALLAVPADRILAAAVDTIVAGVHFPEATPAAAIGHRALAVNLSDLAAIGAEPAWALLSLTLPEIDTRWLAAFAEGFHALAARSGTALVGGDIARGPLSVTVTVHGLLPKGAGLRRDRAAPGDAIYVTGTLGDAAAGLQQIQSDRIGSDDALVRRFYYPEPRVQAGRALASIASAAIDVSDGLLADLGHVAQASGVAAYIETANLTLSDALRQAYGLDQARRLALTGGDDYELCFTVPSDQAAAAEEALTARGCAVTRIGSIGAGSGVVCIDENGVTRQHAISAGYQHFT